MFPLDLDTPAVSYHWKNRESATPSAEARVRLRFELTAMKSVIKHYHNLADLPQELPRYLTAEHRKGLDELNSNGFDQLI